jgi:alpha-tubulin suppressor-like RCC1 family protein
MKGWRRAGAVCLAFVGSISCNGDTITGADDTVAAVTISAPRSDIRVGQSIQLAATPVNASGAIVSGETVAWTTSDAAIAKVEPSGLLTGMGPGSVTITATTSEKSGTVSISVTLVPVSKVDVTLPANPLPAGVPATLSVVVKDSADRLLSGRKFTYSSSNANVATVSETGVVTGKTPGGTVLSVTSEGIIGTVIATVVLGPPASLSINTGEVFPGLTRQLTATLRDPAGNVLPLTNAEWSSSDVSKVGVNQSGVISGISLGTATISVRSGTVTSSAPARTLAARLIDGGTHHGCFLDDQGFAYCWGRNSNDEVGNGVGPGSIVPVPTRVAGGFKFTTITVGSSHACGLLADGTALCWGSNFRGALGDDSNTDRATPTQAATTLRFVKISGGHDHTCALTADGDAYCWGGVNYPSRPTAVIGGPRFVSLTVGYSAACALDSGGQAYCWGNNDNTQLGTLDRIGSLNPRMVATAQRFVSISSSQFVTCGLTAIGEAYCWGLGPGGTAQIPVPPPPVLSSGSVLFKSIAVGRDHVCGLDFSDVPWCWGSNSEGQLGTAGAFSGGPVFKVYMTPTGLTSFASIGVGTHHSCGISSTGVPYCWGRGEALGNNSGDNKAEPVALRSP